MLDVTADPDIALPLGELARRYNGLRARGARPLHQRDGDPRPRGVSRRRARAAGDRRSGPARTRPRAVDPAELTVPGPRRRPSRSGERPAEVGRHLPVLSSPHRPPSPTLSPADRPAGRISPACSRTRARWTRRACPGGAAAAGAADRRRLGADRPGRGGRRGRGVERGRRPGHRRAGRLHPGGRCPLSARDRVRGPRRRPAGHHRRRTGRPRQPTSSRGRRAARDTGHRAAGVPGDAVRARRWPP